MDSETKWLNQRVTLLKMHLQELKQLGLREKSERQLLIQQHGSIAENDPLIKAMLVTQYARQLTLLSSQFGEERGLLLIRQKQDELAQNEQINSERNNSSKSR